jgi:hypothetical protein
MIELQERNIFWRTLKSIEKWIGTCMQMRLGLYKSGLSWTTAVCARLENEMIWIQPFIECTNLRRHTWIKLSAAAVLVDWNENAPEYRLRAYCDLCVYYYKCIPLKPVIRWIYVVGYTKSVYVTFVKSATLSPNMCNRQFGYQIHELENFDCWFRELGSLFLSIAWIR